MAIDDNPWDRERIGLQRAYPIPVVPSSVVADRKTVLASWERPAAAGGMVWRVGGLLDEHGGANVLCPAAKTDNAWAAEGMYMGAGLQMCELMVWRGTLPTAAQRHMLYTCLQGKWELLSTRMGLNVRMKGPIWSQCQRQRHRH